MSASALQMCAHGQACPPSPHTHIKSMQKNQLELKTIKCWLPGGGLAGKILKEHSGIVKLFCAPVNLICGS